MSGRQKPILSHIGYYLWKDSRQIIERLFMENVLCIFKIWSEPEMCRWTQRLMICKDNVIFNVIKN